MTEREKDACDGTGPQEIAEYRKFWQPDLPASYATGVKGDVGDPGRLPSVGGPVNPANPTMPLESVGYSWKDAVTRVQQEELEIAMRALGPRCSEGFPGPTGAVGFSDPPGPCCSPGPRGFDGIRRDIVGIPDDPGSPGTPGEDGGAEPVDSIRCGGGASNDAVLAELNTAITDCLRRIAVLEQYLKPTKFVSLMGTVKVVEIPLVPGQVVETNRATMAPMHEVLGRSGVAGTLGPQCDLGEASNAYRS